MNSFVLAGLGCNFLSYQKAFFSLSPSQALIKKELSEEILFYRERLSCQVLHYGKEEN